MNKFEKLIELIISENDTQARKLFHSIVVENSRKIYEGLVEDDEEVSNDKTDDLVDDVEADEKGVKESLRSVVSVAEARQLLDYMDGTLNESDNSELLQRVAEHFDIANEDLMGRLEEEGDDILDIAYSDEEMGGEENGDMDYDNGDEMGDEMGDMNGDMDYENGDMEGGEGAIEDRVVDLEDAIDELKAEFEELMGDEMNGDMDYDDENGDMDYDNGDEENGDMDYDDDDEMEEGKYGKKKKSMDYTEADVDESLVREYVEKVKDPANSEEGSINKKSTVAKVKNDRGGSTANIIGDQSEESGSTADKASDLKGAKSWENKPGAKAGKVYRNKKSAVNKEESGVAKTSVVNKKA